MKISFSLVVCSFFALPALAVEQSPYASNEALDEVIKQIDAAKEEGRFDEWLGLATKGMAPHEIQRWDMMIKHRREEKIDEKLKRLEEGKRHLEEKGQEELKDKKEQDEEMIRGLCGNKPDHPLFYLVEWIRQNKDQNILQYVANYERELVKCMAELESDER